MAPAPVSPGAPAAGPRAVKPRIVLWALRACLALAVLFLTLAAIEAVLRIVAAVLGDRAAEATGSEVDDCRAVMIVAIGDSMTYGWGATPRESYPARLAHHLRGAYPGLEFKTYNLGIPGSTTSEGLRRLDAFLSERPGLSVDIGLVLYGVNNKWSMREATFWGWDENARREHPAAWAASHTRIGKMLAFAGRAASEAAWNADGGPDEAGAASWAEDASRLSRWIVHDLAEIASRLRGRGAEPLFLSYFDTRFETMNALIAAVARDLGARAVDLAQPRSYYFSHGFYAENRYHLNASGYDDVARRLAAEISRIFPRGDLEKRLAARRGSRICRGR